MASYTTNLNLLKKDPATDGSDTFNIATMLNDNWEKIDAAIGAAKSAEEYDAAATYAVDAYCNHDWKLYKCTTAITVAEAWDAAHWAETTIGAEMEAMLAALRDCTITSEKLADGAVTTIKLADGAVTMEKISESVIPALQGALHGRQAHSTYELIMEGKFDKTWE